MSSAELIWPAEPARFIAQVTPSRTRIFLLREERPPRLQAVTTASNSDADALVSALNDALWQGRTTTFDALSEKLPQAVVTACRAALAAFDYQAFVLGCDGEPMSVLPSGQRTYSWPDSELVAAAESVYTLGLQALFVNEVDEQGEIWINTRLLSDESWVSMEGPVTAWPAPPSTALVERQHPHPSQVFADPRWGTHLGRLHWVWHPDTPEQQDGTATAEWVLEFYDAPVPRASEDEEELARPEEPTSQPEPQFNFELGEWNPWPLTLRARFVLFVALNLVADELAEDIQALRKGGNDQPFQMDIFPVIVRNQPVEWWEQLHRSAERLAEAMRTGVQWNPRTPGEEALLHVASTYEAEGVLDIIRGDPASAITKTFLALPEAEWETDPATGERRQVADLQFGEVLGALAGDTDIELLWDPSMDGIDDPDADYRPPGMADLRPQAWHRPFDMYVGHPDKQSFLFG